ncbi:tetratricopeptide repeat protein [Actinoplanes sp. NPDC049118]|uniref:AfsR/SARP family transcriptional regulator n=1 Tax=Actinoplanes sp. NPDC049118 TaxID=3155769 RepID=UPI0033C058D5
MIEFRLLGDVDVRHAGRPLALGSKQRTVLAVLAFHANTVVSRSDIVRLAWGDSADDPPATIDRLVTDYVSRLRTAFRKAGFGGQVRLVARTPGYLLEVDPAIVDWHRFRDLVTRARAAGQAADHADAAELLRLALALWRGPALADLAARSLDPVRDRMGDLRLAATEDLAAVLLTRGGPDEVVDLLAAAAAGHPGRERMATLLIRALHAAGRRDEAIAAYQRTRAHLTDRLGVDPTDALEEAYRVVLHGRAPTPAPAGTRRPLAQLPADTGNFTGRRAELAHLLSLVPGTAPGDHAGGVVVICAVDGMGGIGKTALAVHAAHRLRDRFPDGCLFLDLHGYTRAVALVEPGQALERLLRALGVPGEQIPADVDDRAALYRSRLAGRRMLIVLDNARTAGQVRPLLPAEPGCLVLVTSRRRLTALDDARPLSLDSMPVADAVTLFTRIAGPGRAAGRPGAVEQVVQLCGRLPLAVRIAAARLRARPAWTVAHLADRLADRHHRLGRLDDGERGVAAAFTLSYDDLTGEQQRMFRRLGLHPGADTDPYAAAALTGHPLEPAGRILEELLDAHLLIQAVPGRYRFHDLMRAYAADLACTRDSDDARRTALNGLFDHYLATAAAAMDALFPAGEFQRPRVPPAGSPAAAVTDPVAARTWLDAERTNLVATCAYTATHGRPGYTGRLSATLALYLDFGGHFADALTVHAHTRDAAGRCGDLAAEAHALANLGTSLDGLGRHAEAVEELRHALLNFRLIGHRAGEARALNNLGYAYCRWGHHEQAVRCTRQGLAIFLETGNRLGQADALDTLGIVHRQQGRYDEATDHSRKALALYRELRDPLGEAMQLERLGAIHARQGRPEQAIDHLRQALALDREIGNRLGEADALNELALVHRQQGRYDEATDHYQQSIDLFRRIGNRTGEGSALNGLAETLHAAGQPDRARELHTAVLALTAGTDTVHERARAHAGIASVHHTAGDTEPARRHWHQALTLYTGLGVPAADAVRANLAALDPSQ